MNVSSALADFSVQSDKRLKLNDKPEPNELVEGEIELPAKKPRPSTRRERIMGRTVPDIRELDRNDIVTFYTHNDTIRYYVRLIDPIERQGIAVFHFNRKGRPSYRFIPRYTIKKDQPCALIFPREISSAILELLRKNGTFDKE